MVTITQEGNLSAPLSNALFQNLKFWVAISVPCRAALIADIKVFIYAATLPPTPH